MGFFLRGMDTEPRRSDGSVFFLLGFESAVHIDQQWGMWVFPEEYSSSSV